MPSLRCPLFLTGKDGATASATAAGDGVVRPQEVHVVANPDGTIDLLPTAGAAAAAAEKKALEEAARDKVRTVG